MKKTFESESDALAASSATPISAQAPATTSPDPANDAPIPAGNGAPDYSQVEIKTESDLPEPTKPGGSATEPESGGGYSG